MQQESFNVRVLQNNFTISENETILDAEKIHKPTQLHYFDAFSHCRYVNDQEPQKLNILLSTLGMHNIRVERRPYSLHPTVNFGSFIPS